MSTPAARLCSACGMCCDGTLFHSVGVQPGDSIRQLSAGGLRIKRKRADAFFHQPCPAHQGSHCTIYDDRPTRCRLFECQQLRRVAAGQITEAEALATIAVARNAAELVDALVNEIADTNPLRALAHRAANALTTNSPTPVHAKLSTALAELETLLDADFRIQSVPKP